MIESPRFTFVRHGQCLANAQGRVAGQLDSPLTPLGHTQAEGAAVQLAGRKDLTAVITSDLQRAHSTARIVAGVLDLPVFVDKGLREQHFGTMQGELFGDLTASSPGREHINEVRWGGGESVADVHARLMGLYARIDAAHPGPVVLVTHGHVIQISLSLLRGRGARDVEWFDLPNGSIVTAPAPDDPRTT